MKFNLKRELNDSLPNYHEFEFLTSLEQKEIDNFKNIDSDSDSYNWGLQYLNTESFVIEQEIRDLPISLIRWGNYPLYMIGDILPELKDLYYQMYKP